MIKLRELLEKPDGDVFQLYHGGTRWQTRPVEIKPGTKGRYEAGVGIYLTNRYLTARKYAMGGKVVHRVDIDKNYKDIGKVQLPLKMSIEFLKNVRGLKNKKEIITDCIKNASRRNADMLPASVINNLIVNYEAGAGKVGLEITKFFIQNGIDAGVQHHLGEEDWLIVFNTNIIKKVVIMPADIQQDEYLLPKVPV
jgi:hypothetical protein